MASDKVALREKNTQKSGEGYAHRIIEGPKGGGNPTTNGGINRATKGQKG